MAAVLSYESLVHAVAGAVGSVTAMTVFFPLDTARLRLQVDEKRKSKTTHTVLMEIIKEEGLLAPYRGWFPVISSLCCSNFVYFYTFNSLKAVWVKGQHSTTGKDLVVGFVAGVVNVLLTTPLWVVNTRLKLQGAKFRNEDIVPTNYKGILDAFHQIVRDEGIPALWNGTLPSLLLVFNPAIQFMFYEGLKRQILKRRVQLSSLDVFVIGAIAKAIATTVTYPMQTVQSILRFGRHRLNPENRTLGSLRNVLYLLHQRLSRRSGRLLPERLHHPSEPGERVTKASETSEKRRGPTCSSPIGSQHAALRLGFPWAASFLSTGRPPGPVKHPEPYSTLDPQKQNFKRAIHLGPQRHAR